MRFTIASAAIIGAAAAHGSWPAQGNSTSPDVYVTEVVTAFTTFCPEATKFTHAGSTYTVSQATTLTITNCPGGCTVTKPVYSSSTPVSVSSAYLTTTAASTPTAVSPVKTSPVASAPVYPINNGTTPVAPAGTAPVPVGTGGKASPTGASTTKPAPYTGAASKASVAGAGFIALFGLVALL